MIVLVGNTVLDRFVDKVASDARKTLEERNIYRCTIGEKERLVVKVDFNSGTFSNFETFFNRIMFDSENNITVIKALQDAVANSSLVQEAIHSKGN